MALTVGGVALVSFFSALITTSLFGCGADKPARHRRENLGAQHTLVIECGAIIDGESEAALGPSSHIDCDDVITSIEPITGQTPMRLIGFG